MSAPRRSPRSRHRFERSRATPGSSRSSASRISCAGGRLRIRRTSRAPRRRCGRAVRFGVEDANAVLGLGSLALIQHEFRAALQHGRTAREAAAGLVAAVRRHRRRARSSSGATTRRSPRSSAWSRFVRASPRMHASRTRASSWATARAPSGRCASHSMPPRASPEPTAWANVELAKLELGLGHTDAARRHARAGLRVLPGYPSARVELARIDAASGRARRRDRRGLGEQPRRSRRRLPSRSSQICSSATVAVPTRARSARRSRSSTAFSRRTASRSTSSRPSHGPTT